MRVAKSRIHGKGVFATREYKKGDLIGEYTGKIITEEKATNKPAHPTYLFDIGKGLLIDATEDDNPIKYINHSCNPNCESEQENNKIFIRAIKDIKKGEELTYDYNLEDEEYTPCTCKSPNCRGTLGKK